MNIQIRFAILLLLLEFSTCEYWSRPMNVTTPADAGEVKLLVDPAGNSHIVWLDSAVVRYLLLDPQNRPLLGPVVLESAHPAEALDFVGDGTKLFVVFQAARGRLTQSCIYPLFAQGCRDIFFVESADGGKTWSQSTVVPRQNMSDIANRQYPSLLYIKEKDRLAIFYAKDKPTDGQGKDVYCVTRVSGSKVFRDEHVIQTSDAMIFVSPPHAGYTIAGNLATIHLHFSGVVDTGKNDMLGVRTYYYQSETATETWKSVGYLVEQFPKPWSAFQVRYSSGLWADPKAGLFLPESLQIGTTIVGTYLTTLKATGQPWSREKLFGVPMEILNMAMCSGASNKLLLLGKEARNQPTFVVYDTNTGYTSVEPDPLYRTETFRKASIGCYQAKEGGDIVVRIVGSAAVGRAEQYAIYVTNHTMSATSAETKADL